MKATVIDTTEMTSKKGNTFRLVSLMYDTPSGFVQAGTFFVPSSYKEPLVPDTTIGVCIKTINGKTELLEIYND